jgi:hypothetical protein
VPVLGLAAANGQGVIEAQPDFLLPKCQHWVEMIGGKTDIDLWFRQLHFSFSGRLLCHRHLDAESG